MAFKNRNPKTTGYGISEIYKKSLLFEILNVTNNTLVEAFTLTLPPESMEIVQPQRVNRKKTFGGVFEDDYGLDNMTIKLSGNTGGVTARYCYRSTLKAEKYSGRESIFNFFDKIVRYKKNVEGEFSDYEIRLYDLSVIEDLDAELKRNSFKIPSDTLGWIVSLDDFKMPKNKDKPLFNNYSLDLFVIAQLGQMRIIKSKKPEKMKRFKLKNAIRAVRSGLGNVTTILNKITAMKNKIESALALVDDFEEQLDSYLFQVADITKSPAQAYRQTLKIATFPLSHARAQFNFFEDVVDYYEDLIENDPVLKAATGEDDYFYVVEEMTKTLSLMSGIVAFGKTKQAKNPESVEVTPYGSDSNPDEVEPETITVYGSRLEIATSSTTLEKLALKNYNDPSLSRLIADFNQINDDTISPGDFIEIPILSEMEVDNENRIFSLEKKDFMGKDIKLKNNGIVISENGDFAIAEGNTTLLQSVNLRLGEKLGKRLRLTLYGLRNHVGGAMTLRSPIVYLLSNVIDTLIQDPRIKAISNVALQGVEDKLYVSFDILSTNKDITKYSGVL